MQRTVQHISEKITHICYVPEHFQEETDQARYAYDVQNRILLTQTNVCFTPKTVYSYQTDEEPIIRKKMTANGEVSYVENEKAIRLRESYTVSLSFEIGNDELLLGLGQYEDGIFNYRNHTEYLYESNMRIAIPFLVTTGGYGILIDSESNMIFTSSKNHISFSIDTEKTLSYYIFTGESIQDIILQYHTVTGFPSLLPRWAFGYIQSKERYQSSRELEDTVAEFRKRQIPIDCIVQDWYTWEEGLWGEKKFDKKRYPNLSQTIQTLHDNHVRFMVSIWPNMSPDSDDYAEFQIANQLLPNSNTYNAFDEDARTLYFAQCKREILSAGTDALWCDNAEPFSDADWNGVEKRCEAERYRVVCEASQKSMEWERLNSYGLYHAKGIYENWRLDFPQKRVVNLTRSGYFGCQKYGTILWSGDITATWQTLRKQITEGLKMGLSGMPYWTLDIGGFFVVNDKYENRGCNDTAHQPLWFWKGDYNEGVHDAGYRELYVRWLQFGAFLPIFRSHGTDTPREPWYFGDTIFYDAITQYIKLRYKLLPYIYSLGAKAHFDGSIIMRSLVMDYPDDAKCRTISDEYMFGDAILVAPVYEPMYYGPNAKELKNTKKTRSVYLPKGCGWYDFFTNEHYEGGTCVDACATLDRIPLFVKEGAIIPTSSSIQYADEKNGLADLIYVYEGSDGHFTYYLDDGDGYEYEEGCYMQIEFHYNATSHELSMHHGNSPHGSHRFPEPVFQSVFISEGSPF